MRELREETGIAISVNDISLYDVENGLDDTLVIFGLAAKQPLEVVRQMDTAEVQEVVLIDRPIELGFPMHTRIVARYFAERTD